MEKNTKNAQRKNAGENAMRVKYFWFCSNWKCDFKSLKILGGNCPWCDHGVLFLRSIKNVGKKRKKSKPVIRPRFVLR